MGTGFVSCPRQPKHNSISRDLFYAFPRFEITVEPVCQTITYTYKQMLKGGN